MKKILVIFFASFLFFIPSKPVESDFAPADWPSLPTGPDYSHLREPIITPPDFNIDEDIEVLKKPMLINFDEKWFIKTVMSRSLDEELKEF